MQKTLESGSMPSSQKMEFKGLSVSRNFCICNHQQACSPSSSCCWSVLSTLRSFPTSSWPCGSQHPSSWQFCMRSGAGEGWSSGPWIFVAVVLFSPKSEAHPRCFLHGRLHRLWGLRQPQATPAWCWSTDACHYLPCGHWLKAQNQRNKAMSTNVLPSIVKNQRKTAPLFKNNNLKIKWQWS